MPRRFSKKWLMIALAFLSCAGAGVYLGDPIELIAHPGWREYDSLDQLVGEFRAVHRIEQSDLMPKNPTAIVSPPWRLVVAISSGPRATIYVEQGGHWLKLDAWLRQFVAAGAPGRMIFRYQVVGNALEGSWQGSPGLGSPVALRDSFSIPLDDSNRL